MDCQQLLEEAERPSLGSTGGVVLDVVAWPGDDDLVLLAHTTGLHDERWLPTLVGLG